MNSETAQFGESVGTALESAAHSRVPPMDVVLCLGGYIDLAVRCAGGSNIESAQIFRALSNKYAEVLPPNLPTGKPIYKACSEYESASA